MVELKAGEFEPEHAGKLNFYLSAVDTQVRDERDGPTIGLLLCRTKSRVIAEYALRDSNKPMGIAEYRLVHALPAQFEASLPSIDQLEARLKDASMKDFESMPVEHETPRPRPARPKKTPSSAKPRKGKLMR